MTQSQLWHTNDFGIDPLTNHNDYKHGPHQVFKTSDTLSEQLVIWLHRLNYIHVWYSEINAGPLGFLCVPVGEYKHFNIWFV